jgi:hypothetical protein
MKAIMYISAGYGAKVFDDFGFSPKGEPLFVDVEIYEDMGKALYIEKVREISSLGEFAFSDEINLTVPLLVVAPHGYSGRETKVSGNAVQTIVACNHWYEPAKKLNEPATGILLPASKTTRKKFRDIDIDDNGYSDYLQSLHDTTLMGIIQETKSSELKVISSYEVFHSQNINKVEIEKLYGVKTQSGLEKLV